MNPDRYPRKDRKPEAAERTRLDRLERCHFRDELRSARAAILKDAEGFDSVLFAVERLGRFVIRKEGTLGRYRDPLAGLLFKDSARRSEFERVFQIVNKGRNHALHVGAAARHLAQNCIRLAILLEGRLSEGLMEVSDFMVRNPVCASRWQTLGALRYAMLAGAFSYLPFLDKGNKAKLVSDGALARYLREGSGEIDNALLDQSLDDALKATLKVERTERLKPDATVKDALDAMRKNLPVVIATEQNEIVGIVTPYDLL